MTSHLVLSMDLQRNLDVGRYSKRKTEDWPDHLRAEDDVRNRRVPGGALLCQVKALEERVRINRRWIREKGRIDMYEHPYAGGYNANGSIRYRTPSVTQQYADGYHPPELKRHECTANVT